MAEPIQTDSAFVSDLQKQLDLERNARIQAERVAEAKVRELSEKQQELLLLQEVVEAANEATQVEAAMQIAVDRVCAHTGWPVGHVYLKPQDSKDELIPSDIWHLQSAERFDSFRRETQKMRFAPGVGLPGRVLASGKPVWTGNVTGDSAFLRREFAQNVGIKAGFAFPVPLGTEVAAVLEFFSDQLLEPDERLLRIMTRIGVQLGRVIERHRAVESVEKSGEEFRRIWENSLDGMRLTGEDGKMLLVNDAFCRMVGMSAEELLGKPFSVIYESDHQASILAKHKERFAERDVQPLFERELLLWHGGKVWFELSNSFLEIPGQPARLLSIFRDITDRKVAEEKMSEFAAQLERSNRELQDFAYVASHDLQEPLRKVAVFGDRLKSKYADALAGEGLDYLSRMQKAAERMQSLISDLLAFSRVTSKSQAFVPVDLNTVLREVLADLEARIEQVGGKIEAAPLATIEAEPLQMRQLLQNLIGNALKFHRPGNPPIIKVEGAVLQDEVRRMELDGTPRTMFRLTISDNGIGFDEKYADKIFQVFQRLHGREAYEGTGMGLAITRKIIEHHGGEIAAKSKPGDGATFVVTLPVKNRKTIQ